VSPGKLDRLEGPGPSNNTEAGSRATPAGGIHVDRALDVLEWLAASGEEKSRQLSDVAQGIAQPKASVHRALSILQRRGYVSQDDRGNYGLGIKCHELGGQWTLQSHLREYAYPVLESLNRESLETVHLSVYDQGDAVYVGKLDSLHQIVTRPDTSNRVPALVVATGRAILAFQSRTEINAQLTRPLPAYTEKTPRDPEIIEAMLAQVREDGYAVNVETYREGVCGIAAPVRDSTGAVVASVGLVVPIHRFTQDRVDRYRASVVSAAVRISEMMGGPSHLVTHRPSADDSP
jgi:DNA-binding IclR family transcriptional regulator